MTPKAEIVKQEYEKFRRRIHPEYSAHPKWDLFWEKLAERLHKNGIDLTAFMAAQFHFQKPLPMPNHLGTAKAFQLYEEFLTKYNPMEAGKRRLSVEIDYLKTRLELGIESLEQILLSRMAPLSPLFRFVIAKENGLLDIAEFFEDGAKQQAALSLESKVYGKAADEL